MNAFNQKVFRSQEGISITGYQRLSQRLHLDLPLLSAITFLTTLGLFILYSASNQDLAVILRQASRILGASVIMIVFAIIPPRQYLKWAPWLYSLGIILLLTVLLAGVISQGAQRWLSLGIVRFQPSEILKLAVPLMLAWYFSERALPPTFTETLTALSLILLPSLLIAKQPDLGTALMIFTSGSFVLLLAGIRWRLIVAALIVCVASTPVIWHYMHSYQQQRVLTFLNPERDPLGAGYHIIQSKIAIGSGGVFGKGWLNGTQSHLDFLPARATDFIFAVSGEEFGLLGASILLIACIMIFSRGIYISTQAQDTFTRLLAGSISLTFFASVFVNIGMVVGILPVVGVPLPLVSYGGTSIVTLLASFGMLMSIHTHRRLLGT